MAESIRTHKVIIVGAGIAGLSAANFLYKNGIQDILVLEAKNKAGGRIQTEQLGYNSANNGTGIVELGAQFIHGEQNDFCKLLKKCDQRHEKFSWEARGEFLTPTGDRIGENVLKEILEWVEAQLEYIEENITMDQVGGFEDPNVGAYLQKKFIEYLQQSNIAPQNPQYFVKTALFQWAMSFQRIDNSCNYMDDLSLYRWADFDINPGEHYNNFKSGGQFFIDKYLVHPIKPVVQFNSPVKKIRWDETGMVTVTTKDNTTFHAESIIVTCSIGVLKTKMGSMFEPRLPTYIKNAILSSGFGPVTKIFLEWDEPWWPKAFLGYQLIWVKEYLNCCENVGEDDYEHNWTKAITGFDPVLDNENVLMGWLGGPEAVFVESLDAGEIGRQCCEVLRRFTGRKVPDVTRVLVSKWNTDEYFCGAYSYRAAMADRIPDLCSVLNEPVCVKDYNENPKPVILFAGEALHQTNYSTMHGAYASGESQAKKCLQYFQQRESQLCTLRNYFSSVGTRIYNMFSSFKFSDSTSKN